MTATFFATPDDFRRWLGEHHASETELIVGFYKRGTRTPSITWPESVDEALCFGWIDGIRRRIDEASYSIRFTPRKARSIWSRVNIGRVDVLTKQGRMRPAGLKAFAVRDEARSGIYSHESEPASLDAATEERFRANERAWEFFESQPPWCRRTATRWVVSAKKSETRERRLATLIDDSEHGRAVGPLRRATTEAR